MGTRERKQLTLPLAVASLAITLMVLPAVARRSQRVNVRAGQLIAAKQPAKRLAQSGPVADPATGANKATPSAPANKGISSGTAAAPATTAGTAPGAVKAESVAHEEPPVDAALLSVLKDLSKAAHQSDEVQKLDDPAQKAAIKSALEAVDTALKQAKVNPDRIVPAADKSRFEKTLNAESWDSGLMSLPNNGHASISILWAKKVNGLVNIGIAGNCGCRSNGAVRIGEYAVVINGKSAMDSGFDIQSQSDVNFWLGRMTAVTADATICDGGATETGATPSLKAVVTDDSIHRQADLAIRQQQEEDQRRQQATQQAVAQHLAAPQPAAAPPAAVPQTATPQTATPATVPEVADRSPTTTCPAVGTPPGEIRNSQESVIVLPELKPPISVPGSDSQ